MVKLAKNVAPTAVVTPANKVEFESSAQKRTYLKQADVPSASLDEALRIPQAILDHYAGKPTSPLYTAKALNVLEEKGVPRDKAAEVLDRIEASANAVGFPSYRNTSRDDLLYESF